MEPTNPRPRATPYHGDRNGSSGVGLAWLRIGERRGQTSRSRRALPSGQRFDRPDYDALEYDGSDDDAETGRGLVGVYYDANPLAVNALARAAPSDLKQG